MLYNKPYCSFEIFANIYRACLLSDRGSANQGFVFSWRPSSLGIISTVILQLILEIL